MRFAIFLLLATVTCIWSYIIPNDARQVFSFDFFKRAAKDYGNNDFVISPAAAQKFLALLYSVAPDSAKDGILYDLKFKYIDVDKPFDAFAAVDMQTAYIKANQVMDYLRNDFKEITNGLTVKNFIAAYGEPTWDFYTTAQIFFDIKIIDKDKKIKRWEEFGEFKSERNMKKSQNLEIFSWINLEANFKNKFDFKNGKLHGIGCFQYGEVNGYHIIKLPLNTENELTLEIFMPQSELSHSFFIYNLGNAMKHMNKYDDDLDWETVEVMLPEFKFENATNIGTALMDEENGIKSMFNGWWPTDTLLQFSFNANTQIDSFWQKTTVHITPSANGETTPDKPTKTFDVSNKSFIYFIKSKDVLYFIGTRYVPEED